MADVVVVGGTDMATIVIVVCIVVVSLWLVSSVVGKRWESGRKWETLCKVDAHVWSCDSPSGLNKIHYSIGGKALLSL